MNKYGKETSHFFFLRWSCNCEILQQNWEFQKFLNPLSANPTKWSNTLKRSSQICWRIVYMGEGLIWLCHAKTFLKPFFLNLGIHKRGFKCCSCSYLMTSEVFPKFTVSIGPLCVIVRSHVVTQSVRSHFFTWLPKNYQMVWCTKCQSSDQKAEKKHNITRILSFYVVLCAFL